MAGARAIEISGIGRGEKSFAEELVLSVGLLEAKALIAQLGRGEGSLSDPTSVLSGLCGMEYGCFRVGSRPALWGKGQKTRAPAKLCQIVVS